MSESPQTAKLLLETAEPFLNARNQSGLAEVLRRDWSVNRLCELLETGAPAVAQVAATGIGLIGGMTNCKSLAAALHSRFVQVARASESALWSIWFRAAGANAQHSLFLAIQPADDGDYNESVARLTELGRLYPNYAEVSNQRALCHYMNESYLKAMGDYERALRLNPYHFAAMAGMAHCFAHMRRFEDALQAYRGVLQIHPRMEGVRQAIRQIRAVVPHSRRAAGATGYTNPDDSGSIERKYSKS